MERKEKEEKRMMWNMNPGAWEGVDLVIFNREHTLWSRRLESRQKQKDEEETCAGRMWNIPYLSLVFRRWGEEKFWVNEAQITLD